MNFTFNEEKHELTVEEDGVKRRFILYDNLWDIIYLILKAIDELDDGGTVEVEVENWAKPNSTEKIPVEKLDVGTGAGQILALNENGKVPDGVVTPEEVFQDGDILVINGGGA